MGAHWRGSRRNKPRAPTAEDPAEDDERDAADVDPHPAAFGSRWWIVDLDLHVMNRMKQLGEDGVDATAASVGSRIVGCI
jgi:hypothetical protein